MKANTEELKEALVEALKTAFPIHRETAQNLAKAHGPKVALNYLRIAGSPPSAPKRIRPPSKVKGQAKRPIHNIECPKCGNGKSWGVGGGICSERRYRTYKCMGCLKCHRIYID